MPTTDRPLHPDGIDDNCYQHPLAGCGYVWSDDYQSFHIKDPGRGGDDRDITIQQGQKVHRRLEAGDWLAETQPEPILRMIHQGYIDQVYPLDFSGEGPESEQLIERVDMANSVMDAGGACTICGVEPGPDGIDHRIGCEWTSWLLHSLLKMDGDGEESLRSVVRRALDQIERMQ